MSTLIAIADKASYNWYIQATLITLIAGGFIAATVIGSIGWYSSKRPAGWESAEAPNWVAKLSISNSGSPSSENK